MPAQRPATCPTIVAGVTAPDVLATARVVGNEVPTPFDEVTLTFPAVKLPAYDTAIEVVPWPLTIVPPVGTVHAYPFAKAPDTATTE